MARTQELEDALRSTKSELDSKAQSDLQDALAVRKDVEEQFLSPCEHISLSTPPTLNHIARSLARRIFQQKFGSMAGGYGTPFYHARSIMRSKDFILHCAVQRNSTTISPLNPLALAVSP
ncbi:hypothetical protein BDN70DRAFT_938026 [Pholiota conissans]|uniref:Uncharacterized protein n=1 Tax=Pholiota conissans TaxID=109636 RepID=A0A9P5YMS8_9AGAR|nr:hypothetical protein BDN70DRAFT_938026 [Pholiota conissans]